MVSSQQFGPLISVHSMVIGLAIFFHKNIFVACGTIVLGQSVFYVDYCHFCMTCGTKAI